MISVIMPVYNAEQYLKESIESILKQTYKCFEFIIVNDGSTDNSLDVIKFYQNLDDRIKLITRENRGLVESLNEGLKIANGKYIARMDADDISALNRLEKQMEFLELKKLDLCGCKYTYIGKISEYDKIKLESEFKAINNLKNDELIVGRGHSICHPSFLFKKSILNKIGFYDKNFLIAEDLAFQLRFLMANKEIGILDEELYVVRKHEESKSSIENIDNAIETMKLRSEYIINKYIKKDSKVLIWGCGTGGLNLYYYLKETYEFINVIGFIDSNNFNQVIKEKKTFNPEQLSDIKFDYILIATSPGKIEVQKNLDLKGFEPIKDYFCIYS